MLRRVWLLPHFSAVSAAAIRVYYRASCDGEAVQPTGPVLLVGNHPNSLMDPAFLAWVSRRPVRFLAKAPLFTNPFVGWLVRGSGSLPVYRRQDDATLVGKNDETFRAVHDALGQGSAVAIFPEGISHSEPGLTPLKTGAARIALGALRTVGRPFPIVPVGLLFRAKERFRSEAHAIVGAPVRWDDLAGRSDADHDAVLELTERIDRAMRQITLNLARWEDEPVIRTAEAVWSSARAVDPSPSAHVARLALATETLARLRASGDARWDELARDVKTHARVLQLLGMRPADVNIDTRLTTAARWAMRRLTFAGVLQGAVAAIAIVVFWVPYRLTGMIAARMTKTRDTVSTYRVLAGVPAFLLWSLVLASLVAAQWGWRAGILVFLALPLLGVAGLACIERASWILVTVRRWLLLRSGDPRIEALRQRQEELAVRLDDALAAQPTST
jgi:glycerol-3-phosphate O-acyltransferase/dihydroxyacetone phosphate acyltransferase